MQIAFALIAVFWWIAVWGLSDLLTEDWTREQKFQLYIGMLCSIALLVFFVPTIVKRF